MTNIQLLFAVAIPTLAVFMGILHDNARFNSLENSMNSRFAAIEARLISIEADLRRFYEILGAHGADIETLKKRI